MVESFEQKQFLREEKNYFFVRGKKSDLESSSLSISESTSLVCSRDPVGPDPSAIDHQDYDYVTTMIPVIDHHDYDYVTKMEDVGCYLLTTVSPQ